MNRASTPMCSENLASNPRRLNEGVESKTRNLFDCKTEKEAIDFVNSLNIHERGEWLLAIAIMIVRRQLRN